MIVWWFVETLCFVFCYLCSGGSFCFLTLSLCCAGWSCGCAGVAAAISAADTDTVINLYSSYVILLDPFLSCEIITVCTLCVENWQVSQARSDLTLC